MWTQQEGILWATTTSESLATLFYLSHTELIEPYIAMEVMGYNQEAMCRAHLYSGSCSKSRSLGYGIFCSMTKYILSPNHPKGSDLENATNFVELPFTSVKFLV